VKGLVGALLIPLLLGLSSCGLPANPVTPPEVLVAGESGASGGNAVTYSFPFSQSPAVLSTLSIPAGDTVWGSADVDNALIVLARSSSQGFFLVAPLPLSSASPFVKVTLPTGYTPWALATVTPQVLVVLMTTQTNSQGCLALFDANTLVQETGGGSIAPSSCQPIPGQHPSLSGGFLIPLTDGVMFLAGVVTGSGSSATTQLYLLTQTSVLSGGPLSPQAVWTLADSYPGGGPLSGAAESEAVLLPDPRTSAVDLYPVTTLYSSRGGTLSPISRTSLSLSVPPTLLAIDPANNFLVAGSPANISLFGLGSILNPGGTLGALGSVFSLSGESVETLTIYTGSS